MLVTQTMMSSNANLSGKSYVPLKASCQEFVNLGNIDLQIYDA